MEFNDEWTEARRYPGLEFRTRVDATRPPTGTTKDAPAVETLSA